MDYHEIRNRKLILEKLGFGNFSGLIVNLGNDVRFSLRTLNWYKIPESSSTLERQPTLSQITADKALSLLNEDIRRKILFNLDLFFPKDSK